MRRETDRCALVTGAGGMLGTEVVSALASDWRVVEVDVGDFDISDADVTLAAVRDVDPQLIVNCAAYTNVDAAESDRQTALAVNARGAGSVARAAEATGARMIHMSTDYVFDGSKRSPYTEDDPTGPLGVYGESKLEGEREVGASGAEALIVRTAWLYGHAGPNFVETVLRLADSGEVLRMVDDQRGSPTSARDLALVLKELSVSSATGLVNATNSGSATWYDFASEALLLSGRSDVEIVPVATEEFPRPAPRPRSSVLSLDRLASVLGWVPRPWEEALSDYISER